MSALSIALIGAAFATQLAPRDPSSRLRPRMVEVKTDVRKVLNDFARCTVQAHRKNAREMILSSEFAIRSVDRPLWDPDCLNDSIFGEGGGTFQISPTVARFSFADALFGLELVNSDPRTIAAAPEPVRTVIDEQTVAKMRNKIRADKRGEFDESLARSRQELRYYDFGECIVRADASKAKALLLTQTESGEEARAVTNLSPVLTRCKGSDQAISLDPGDVRGTVALSYVRLAYAAGAGAVQ